jgi:hypothetical protein
VTEKKWNTNETFIFHFFLFVIQHPKTNLLVKAIEGRLPMFIDAEEEATAARCSRR